MNAEETMFPLVNKQFDKKVFEELGVEMGAAKEKVKLSNSKAAGK